MKCSKEELVSQLLDSYVEVGGINHIEGVNLPSKQAIADITEQLLQLLFPGFYSKCAANENTLQDAIAKQVDQLCADLCVEVTKSLEFNPLVDVPVEDYKDLSHQVIVEFLCKLPEIRQLLRTDVEAAYDGDPAATSFDEIILAYPGLEAIAVQRLAHQLHLLKVPLIPRMMTEWVHSRVGIDIHPGAEIGSHFFIDHGTGVVVGETTQIGQHVKIYHGVTLGAKSTSGGQSLRGAKRHPTIEDGVTIYPGATILGGETRIGKGSTIGGNVFLFESVPAKSLVLYEKGSVTVKPKWQNSGADSFSDALNDSLSSAAL